MVLLLYWIRLSPVVLSPSVLSKGVETGPTETQIGPACAQTMPRLPGACLRQAECGACPLFLLQKELFSSFYHMTDFSIMQQNFLLCNKVSCCAVKLSAVY